ncbi:MAG: amidase [Pseudomonadota bacterium]
MKDDRPLWQLSASSIAALIADGTVSSAEVTRAAIDRMKQVNPALNAIVDALCEEAIKEANELDCQMARSGPVGPLHGVPITIKQNTDQAGRATPNGVTAFKDNIASEDSPIVCNFKRAGAVIIGRTNTPEFSFRATTANALYGRTLNPWNDWATAGGSSGGAASAVMSGMCALSHGNDLSGSLRFPAAAAGAASIKPGLGRTPAYNSSASVERGILSQIMVVQGVIAREVRDLRLAMGTLIQYDPHDPWMVKQTSEGESLERPIKVAFTRDTFEFDLHPAVETALETARYALTEAGYAVTETTLPDIRKVSEEMWRALLGEVNILLGPDIEAYGSETFKSVYANYLELFRPYHGEALIAAMARRSHHVRAWQLFLQEFPLVLTPFMPHPTLAWDRDAQGKDGVMEMQGASIYAGAINYLGLPAGCVPARFNEGLPIGIQIIGRRFREDLIIDACEAIEKRVGVMAEKLFERL